MKSILQQSRGRGRGSRDEQQFPPGDTLGLNGSTSFEKLVFVGNANGGPIDPPIDVSEPGTLGLMGAGLMGLGLAWRRRKDG